VQHELPDIIVDNLTGYRTQLILPIGRQGHWFEFQSGAPNHKKSPACWAFLFDRVPDCRRRQTFGQVAQRLAEKRQRTGQKPKNAKSDSQPNPASAQNAPGLSETSLQTSRPQAFPIYNMQQTKSPRINLRKSLALELLLCFISL